MAEDALSCFTSLLECIPGWIEELERLAKNATDRQKDKLCENQPIEPEEVQPGKATKSCSIRTRRSKESKKDNTDGLQVVKVDQSVPTVVQTQIPHMDQADALRLSQRKRKTASVCSDRLSGPLKYRSRSMVVVYYDSEVQKQFENMVRAIGTRRNALRKGRTSAQVYVLARKGSTGSGGSSGDDFGAYLPQMAYRSVRMRHSPGSGAQKEELAAFDRLDAFLEKAQAQCERAAHQILRDGDCGVELQAAKDRFEEARLHCETEVPVWQKRIDEAAERERDEEERMRAEGRKDVTPLPDYSSSEKLINGPYVAAVPLEVDLEPDDSDGGDDGKERDITVSLVQLGRPRPFMKTASLTAH